MTTNLIKSYEIDGIKVEIRIEDKQSENDKNVVACFMYELLCK